MTQKAWTVAGTSIPVYSLNTLVVGTGAAGYNAADTLYTYGARDIAIVTEDVNAGTSRNTGSDKQTYYKLTLSGSDNDSVREMAQTLFDGQCVDGDIALCEAALSAPAFLKLAGLGVAFPQNRYGEYIGYKTDHDPRRRATSVGPYTSRQMTECLQRAVESKGIRVFDRMQVIRVLADGEKVYGVLCLHRDAPEGKASFTAFHCTNVVFATGGPAGMYADSVYPEGHHGATGLAFAAGAMGKNLTEWQYGLASLKPRWNVSGTYMQVLPRFLSTDEAGGEPREFLTDYFTDPADMLTKIFLKGYQWPFDVRKIDGGSSLLDILVYRETERGRRVFLDFRENPLGGPIDFSSLGPEARDYLQKAGACLGTPIERLRIMNQPAVDFYAEHGVDLAAQPLEIALCAQHNNGGIGIDCWWQSNVEGFFVVGEAAASHGVYRPGGSALNAGQTGAMRAARYISARRAEAPPAWDVFAQKNRAAVSDALSFAACVLGDTDNADALRQKACVRMSRIGGAIRSLEGIGKALAEIKAEMSALTDTVRVDNPARLPAAYRLWDTLLCQFVYLSAMADYIEKGGQSRGSALYTDPRGIKPYDYLPAQFTYSLDSGANNRLQEIRYQDGQCQTSWREARPIPEDDDFFENVWRNFRENGNID